LLKTWGIGFLKHGCPEEKRGRLDGARATSLLITFGAARSDGIPDASLDELLGFLHLHHVSGQSMSPSGRALFQFQFGILNFILFKNISQYLKLTNFSFGNFGNKIL
jgi:hypothetical protein